MKKLLAFLFCVLVCAPWHANAASQKESVYTRVTRTGHIRCGYAMWTPILYKDMKADKLTGFARDLMEEIGKRLNLTIDWSEETGWGTIVEGLHTDRYDMICVGLANSSGRAKFIDFSTPLFYSPLYLVARKNDSRFDSGINMLNDPQYKMAVLDGEIASIIVAQTMPKISTDAMPQTSDYSLTLKEVETKKADVTIVTPETFADYDHNNPGKLKIAAAGKPVTTFPASFGLPQGDLAFKRMIDVTITELILDGTVERLLKLHEKYPGAFLRVGRPYEAP